MRHRHTERLVLALGAILLGGCAQAMGPGAGPRLSVFGAASLREALGAATEAYEEATGFAATVATDSSTTLRTQLEQGAHADVFLSADTTNPEALVVAGLADGEAVPFAGNALAIVTPADNPAGLASPFDLATPGLKVIAAGESVPISGYAATLLERLAALPGAPADLVVGYGANVVSREDNVGAVLSKIELGEGDVAIVYASDTHGSTSIARIEIPSGAGVIAAYAGIVPSSADDPAGGHAFLDWLAGREGQAILRAFGFEAAP